MDLSAPIPIIRIFSEQKAKEFYLDFLGFTLEWEHRFEDQARRCTRRSSAASWSCT